LLKVARDNILDTYDDAIVNSLMKLIADVIALHSVHPDDLLNSDLLTRLYTYANQYHPRAVEASLDQAEYEFRILKGAPRP